MKTHLIAGLTVLLGSLCLFSGCKPTGDASVTIQRNGKDEVYTVNFKEIKDSSFVRLGDFAGDFEIIPLETTEDSYLKYANPFITEKYILCNATRNGIYQFDRQGRFIRKLVTAGQGPNEVMPPAIMVCDEEKGELILSSAGKDNYFLCFNLETGQYIRDIPKAVPSHTRDLLYAGDRELLCVPYRKPEKDRPQYYAYWQDTDGNVTRSIKGPPNLVIGNGSRLYRFDKEFRYQLKDSDTLYTIRKDGLVPCIIFNYGEPNPIGVDKAGYKRGNVLFETTDYMFLSLFMITRVDRQGGGFLSAGAVTWICLDKKQKKASLQGLVENDIIGGRDQSQEIILQQDGAVVISYQAAEIKELAGKASADPDTPSDIRERLEKIDSSISEEDNPVLLIGKLK